MAYTYIQEFNVRTLAEIISNNCNQHSDNIFKLNITVETIIKDDKLQIKSYLTGFTMQNNGKMNVHNKISSLCT